MEDTRARAEVDKVNLGNEDMLRVMMAYSQGERHTEATFLISKVPGGFGYKYSKIQDQFLIIANTLNNLHEKVISIVPGNNTCVDCGHPRRGPLSSSHVHLSRVTYQQNTEKMS